MIFVPDYLPSTYPCVVVQNATTLRAYRQTPYNPSVGQTISIIYRDFYYNDTAHYYYTDGNQNFGNTTALPSCLAQNRLTNDVYYRNDFADILIIFAVLSIVCFYIPFKVMSRFFRRS